MRLILLAELGLLAFSLVLSPFAFLLVKKKKKKSGLILFYPPPSKNRVPKNHLPKPLMCLSLVNSSSSPKDSES